MSAIHPTAGPRRALSSVTNALLVLSYLADAGEAGVSEISRHVGVTVGTAHRLVATLVASGFAEQNPENRKYRASQKLVTLAHKVRQTIDARAIAHRFLLDLVRNVDETGNLAILHDGLVLYVDKVTSSQAFGIEARVGSRLPMYCTALGKVLVAGLADDRVEDYIKSLEESAKHGIVPSPPDVSVFRDEIRRARLDGYALDPGQYLSDVYCAAAPVRGVGGAVVAAISVSVPRSRFAAQRKHLIKEMCHAADGLSATLDELGLPESALDFADPGFL